MNCISCGQELADQDNVFSVCSNCGSINIKNTRSDTSFTQRNAQSGDSKTSQANELTARQATKSSKLPIRWVKNINRTQLILATSLIIIGCGGTIFAFHSTTPKPKTNAVTTAKPQPPLADTNKPVVTADDHPTTASTTPSPKVVAPTPKAAATPSACYQISGNATRANSDRPDDNPNAYQIHIVYVIPSDGTDNHYDTNGRLSSSVSSWENWLCQQTSGKYLRLDTYNGALDITFVQLSASDSTIKTGSDLPWSTDANHNPYVRDDLEIHLKNKGFTDTYKLYAVYYDGNSNFSCGGGAFPPILAGHVAAEYMHGGDPNYADCSTNKLASSPTQAPGYLDYDMVHETVHTLGIVPSCAPHTFTSHVSDSPKDLMYAGNQPWDTAGGLVLDINHDDYYDAHIAGCLDLKNSAFLVGGGSQLPPSW